MDPLLNTGLLVLNTNEGKTNPLDLENTTENENFSETLTQSMDEAKPATATQLPSKAEKAASQTGQESAETEGEPTVVEATPSDLSIFSMDELTQFMSDTRQPILYQAVDVDDVNKPEVDLTLIPQEMAAVEPIYFTPKQDSELNAASLINEDNEDNEDEDLFEPVLEETDVAEEIESDGLDVAFELPERVLQRMQEWDEEDESDKNVDPLFDVAVQPRVDYFDTSKPSSLAIPVQTDAVSMQTAVSDFNANTDRLAGLGTNEMNLFTQDLNSEPTQDDIHFAPVFSIADQTVSMQDNQINVSDLENLPPVPVQQNFEEVMTERVLWLVKADIQSAEISLDPPELGPIQIKINIQNQEANIGFQSNVAEVRDLLSESVYRLKEMLESEGLNLGNVDISHRDTAQEQHKAMMHQQRQDNRIEAELEIPQVATLQVKKPGLDLFA